MVIVGYINVGKFFLFNRFICVGVFVENVLFVIFDFMIWCVIIFDGWVYIFIDMVGFVWYLLYDFVEVFVFILEEMVMVDVFFYVVDVDDLDLFG